MDVRMGGINGLETLRKSRGDPKLLVIHLMTARMERRKWPSEAMTQRLRLSAQAFDAENQGDHRQRPQGRARHETSHSTPLPTAVTQESEDYELGIVRRSNDWQVFQPSRRAGGRQRCDRAVTGESGTGKELVARVSS